MLRRLGLHTLNRRRLHVYLVVVYRVGERGFDFGPGHYFVWYMLPAIIGRAAASAVESNLNSLSRSPFYLVT